MYSLQSSLRKCPTYLVETLEARRLLAVISGAAFLDANGNGVRDSGEGALGVSRSVYLDLNNNGFSDTGEPTAAFGASGSYAFNDLPAGTYFVRGVAVLQGYTPATLAQTSPANYAARVVTVATGDTVSGVDFGYLAGAKSVLADIYRDLNDNGVKDSADFPLVNTLLYADLNNDSSRQPDEPIVAKETGHSTTTMQGLLTGTYVVRMLVPAEYHQTKPAGNAGITFTLDAAHPYGEAYFLAAYDFAEILGLATRDFQFFPGESQNPLPPSPDIYLDLDLDNQVDPGEPVTSIQPDGSFRFDRLLPGTYTVRPAMIPGWSFTFGQPSPATVTVTSGSQVTNVRFSLIRGDATVSGRFFKDTNQNGSFESDDWDSDDVRLLLTHSSGYGYVALHQQSGEFTFGYLRPGTYRLSMFDNSDYYQFKFLTPPGGTSEITVQPGQTVTTPAFTYRRAGTDVQVRIFHDANMDDYYTTDEPLLSGLTVYQDINANGARDSDEPFGVTNNYGQAYLEDVSQLLTPYRVELPDGWRTTSSITQYRARDGGGLIQLAIGVLPKEKSGIVRGFIFVDSNGNNVRDSGEEGRSEYVWLDLNNNRLRDANEPFGLSAHDGTYTFRSLSSGNFTAYIIPGSTYAQQTYPTRQNGVPVSLSSGGEVANVNFAMRLSGGNGATLQGMVFLDADRNGSYVQDPDQPIFGRTVYIDADNDKIFDSGEQFTTTEYNGKFFLTGLPAGTYKVRQILPVGWGQSTPANGFGLNYTVSSNQIASSQRFGATDFVAPEFVGGGVSFTDFVQFGYTFSEMLYADYQESDFTFKNLTTGEVLPCDFVDFTYGRYSYNHDLRAMTGLFNDGNYLITLPREKIRDASGNVAAADMQIPFFFLRGDANFDRLVDTQDFALFAQNYASLDTSYVRGDFNFDRKIDSVDLNILISQFGRRLPPHGGAVSFQQASPLFSAATLAVTDEKDRLTTGFID